MSYIGLAFCAEGTVLEIPPWSNVSTGDFLEDSQNNRYILLDHANINDQTEEYRFITLLHGQDIERATCVYKRIEFKYPEEKNVLPDSEPA